MFLYIVHLFVLSFIILCENTLEQELIEFLYFILQLWLHFKDMKIHVKVPWRTVV